MTHSGKTICARRLAAAFTRRGTPVIVHDKFYKPGDVDWGYSSYVTNDPDLFLYWVDKGEGCAVFVDEAPELCSNTKAAEPFQQLATQGRHKRHVCHFIAQGPRQIAHQIRANCPETYAFKLRPGEAKKLFEEVGEEWAKATVKLPNTHFFHEAPFQPTVKKKLF